MIPQGPLNIAGSSPKHRAGRRVLETRDSMGKALILHAASSLGFKSHQHLWSLPTRIKPRALLGVSRNKTKKKLKWEGKKGRREGGKKKGGTKTGRKDRIGGSKKWKEGMRKEKREEGTKERRKGGKKERGGRRKEGWIKDARKEGREGRRGWEDRMKEGIME